MKYLKLYEDHSAYDADKDNLQKPNVAWDNEHVHYSNDDSEKDTYHFICFYIKDGTSELKYFINEDIDINNPKSFTVTKEQTANVGLTRIGEMGYSLISNKSKDEITPFNFILTLEVEDESGRIEFSNDNNVSLLDENNFTYIYLSQISSDFEKYKGLYGYEGDELTNETTIVE